MEDAELAKRLDELKNGLFFLSESVAKSAGAAGKLGDIAAALELLARKTSENAASLADVQSRIAALPPQDALAGMAKRMETLADSVSWIARQNNEAFDSLKQFLQRADALATRAQLETLQAHIADRAGEADVREVASKLSALSESVGWSAREAGEHAKHLETLSNKLEAFIDAASNAAQAQHIDALATRLDEVHAAVQVLSSGGPLKQAIDRFGEGARVLDNRMDALEGAFTAVAVKLGETVQESHERVVQAQEATLGAVSTLSNDVRAGFVGLGVKLDESAGRAARLERALESVEKTSASIGEATDKALYAFTQTAPSVLQDAFAGTNEKLEALARQAQALQAASDRVSLAVQGSLDRVPSQVQAAVSEQIGALQKATLELKESTEDTRRGLEAVVASLSDKLPAQIRDGLAETTSRLDAIQKQFSDLASLSASLSQQLQESRESLPAVIRASLADEMKAVHAANEDVRTGVQALVQRVPQAVNHGLEPSLTRLEETRAGVEASQARVADALANLKSLDEKVLAVERTLGALATNAQSQQKQNQLLGETLALVNKDLNAQSTAFHELADGIRKLSERLDRVTGELAEHRKQSGEQTEHTRAIAGALTSLVKETAQLEKDLAQAKEKMQDPAALYAAMEKRLMGRLSEKLAQA